VSRYRLQPGDPVCVGAAANQTPGHVLFVHRLRSGRTECVVRTVDLGGRVGENLNLRVYDDEAARVLRPRATCDIHACDAGVSVHVAH